MLHLSQSTNVCFGFRHHSPKTDLGLQKRVSVILDLCGSELLHKDEPYSKKGSELSHKDEPYSKKCILNHSVHNLYLRMLYIIINNIIFHF